MTDSLYRKEAMDARGRSLYGQVILRSPPSTWLILILLLVILALIGAGLFGLTIGAEDLPLWEWVTAQFSSAR